MLFWRNLEPLDGDAIILIYARTFDKSGCTVIGTITAKPRLVGGVSMEVSGWKTPILREDCQDIAPAVAHCEN
jgi:hypothetical protein